MKRKLLVVLAVLPFLLTGCLVEGTLVFDDSDGVIVEFASVDSEDGFIENDRLVLYGGILVEEYFSTGFLSFQIYQVPRYAVITSAYLHIGVHSVYPLEDSVLVNMYIAPDVFAGSFAVFMADEHSYVLLDVTDLLIEARWEGIDFIQIRFEARNGGVYLEDGGDNLGTGLIPLLEVTYF